MSVTEATLQEQKSPVKLTVDITPEKLSSLLKEYTEHILQCVLGRTPYSLNHAIQRRDINYLADRLEKLLSIASAMHEYHLTNDGMRFELELRIFDAEKVLQAAESYRK